MITKKYIERTIEFSIKDFKKNGMTVFLYVCAIPIGVDWDQKEKKIDIMHRKEIPMNKLKKFKSLIGNTVRLDEAIKIEKKMTKELVDDFVKYINSVNSLPDRITGKPINFNKVYELKGSSEI